MTSIRLSLCAIVLAFCFESYAIAQSKCSDEASDSALFEGKDLDGVMDALATIGRSCVLEINSAHKAAIEYSGFAAETPDSVKGYLPALEALASDAQANALNECSIESGSSKCDYSRAIATRMRTNFASAKGLADAFTSIGSASAPQSTIDADDNDFKLGNDFGGTGFSDILIGRSPVGEDAGGALLPRTSICGFIVRGEANSSACLGDEGGDLSSFICDADCAGRAAQVSASFRKLVAVGWLYGAVTGDTIIAQQFQRDKINAEQWNSYWFGGGSSRTQWPWEALVNGELYEVEMDNEGRFIPPNDALIIMHPGLGASLFDSNGNSVEVTALVEVLGYSKWRYSSTTGKREGEWGGSIIAAYAPSESADDWAYGVLVRTPYKGLNISWIRRDSDEGTDDALLFSVNLNDLAGTFADADRLCSRYGVSVPGVCSSN